ncbi:hypothetical protein MMC17_005619 [Xylographa soralifera]|nr:hypothetical protein [Xylographa soralifera]
MSDNSTAGNSTEYAPLAVVNATNRGGWIVITAVLGWAIVLICFVIRTYVRRVFLRNYGIDDAITATATGTALCQTILVCVQIAHGLGQPVDTITPANLITLQKYAYASDVLFIVTLALSKCAVIFLYQRILYSWSKPLYAVLGMTIAWTIAAVLGVCLQCDPVQPWQTIDIDTGELMCTKLVTQWAGIGAFDIVTELAIFSISIYMVWTLQMAFKSQVIVVFAFACRLPIIAPAILHILYLRPDTIAADPSFQMAFAVVCAQIEMDYGAMAATIPCLGPFLKACRTHTEIDGRQRPGRSFGLNTLGDPMSKMTSKGSKALHSGLSSGARGNRRTLDQQIFRPDYVDAASTATPEKRMEKTDQQSIESHDSRRMIIKKKTEYHVQYESTKPGGEIEIEEVNLEPS